MNKHLKIVRGVVWDMRAKWRELGVELDIDMGTLEVGHCAVYLSCMSVYNKAQQYID